MQNKTCKIINADRLEDLGFYEEKYDGYHAIAANPDDAARILETSSKQYKIKNKYTGS